MSAGWRPRARVVTVAPPAGSVLPLADIKLHLRVDHADEDAAIAGYLAAATAAVERITQRLVIPRQVVLQLPGLPPGRCPVELPGGPVSAVASILADGVPVAGASVAGHSPALLLPDADWPAVSGDGLPVVITYTAGHAPVPPELLGAIKLICGHLYARREAVAAGVSVSEVPLSARFLMEPLRIRPL
ncbi:MAG: head-tail connector protein [Gemmobacter sp.]